MKNNNQLVKVTIILICFYFIVFAALIWLVFPSLDSTAKAGIVGILAGSLAGALGSVITSLLGTWERSRDINERIKERVSSDSLQLTKMDYELRQKSLELQQGQQYFLAPVKVYRELYKALLELNEKGTWPKNIEELGLLNIFPLGVVSEEVPPYNNEIDDNFRSSFVVGDDD